MVEKILSLLKLLVLSFSMAGFQPLTSKRLYKTTDKIRENPHKIISR
jgi:hypothetical protein